MDNIETLLAAVAQTQGFDDDEPAVSTPSEVGLENSRQSPVIRGGSRVSQVIGEVFGDVGPSTVEDKVVPAPISAFPPVRQVIGDGEKRKRGRPPKGQVAAKPPPPKRVKVEDEEEDVCFICFDGGSLVLCDRKGCPKAYHPACIKRDEAFFQSKAKWNCGWHICSVCLKTSHYTCYTCTYSLCKGCIKDTDYVSVRRNKGFCSTCMKMITLIENKDQATNASVDFDDQMSWEYLFKVYWVILKEKLSLTMNELMQAKNPCKGVTAVACKPQFSNVLHTAVGGEVSSPYRTTEHLELNKPHVENNLILSDGSRTAQASNNNHVEKVNSDKGDHAPSYDGLRTAPSSNDNHVEKINGDKGEHVPSSSKVTVKPNTDKVADQMSIIKTTDEPVVKEATEEPCIVKDQDDPSIVKDTNKPSTYKMETEKESDKPGIDSSQWASKELLEFVAYMKNGDTSPMSQFDVQTLLLDYIKRNNLRDPRRKSQIICDLRLKTLFGKPRVGHIEMLKLLEFHSLLKEDSKKNSFIPAGIVSSVASDANLDANAHALPMLTNSRKRKTRKRSDDRPPQNDLNEYAAIDLHNINLIYLRRNLMENLIDDRENFKNKVIGSIVRIRISTNDQKPEVFRLVQVVGTSKVAEPYSVGDRTTDVMLEVLNLDKKEVVSIDAISNLEFTEDECRRLRQSIRCGLVKQFTVGEVQKKALAIQSVRVNDWLEAEVMRLNHLRDRASEKGRKKELREYVDRLELLKSPEERQRRISEVPEIHADPKMSPNYESEEDSRIGVNSKKDARVRPSHSSYPRKGRKLISPNRKGEEERSAEAQSRILEKTEASGSNGLDKHMNQINIKGPSTSGRNDQAMQRPVVETCTLNASTGNSPSSDNIETEKLWHYRDPNAKIQGPFAMMQLRKWSTTGLFPPDMRIWTNHEQYDSLLLTDALKGKLHGASDPSYKASSDSHENRPTGDIGVSEGTNGTSRDNKQTEPARSENASVPSDKNTGLEKADQSGSSGWPHCWDLLKDSNSSAADVQERNLLKDSHSGGADVRERNLLKDSNSGAADVQERNLLKDSHSGGADVQERNLLKDSHSGGADVQERNLPKDSNSSADGVQERNLLKDSNSRAADVQEHNLLKDSNSSVADVQERNLLKDSNSSADGVQERKLLKDNKSSAGDVQERNLLPPSSTGERNGVFPDEARESNEFNYSSHDGEKNSIGLTQNVATSGHSETSNVDRAGQPCEENPRSVEIDLSSNIMEPRPVSPLDLSKRPEIIELFDFPSPTPKTEIQQSLSPDVPVQDTCILELLSPAPRSNNQYQEGQAIENKQSGFTIFPTSGSGWPGSVQLPEVADEWCGFSPTPARPSIQEWDAGLASASSSKPPEGENINTQPASNTPNWLTIMNEPIEFDALGEESVSDLLAEVDAMESRGALPSPTSAMKFARELMEDCKDDCFSSIEEFSPTGEPRRSDAFSSTTDLQLTSQSSARCEPVRSSPVDAFDFFKRSSAHSSASSEGETNAPVHSGEAGSEFHPPTPNNTGQDMTGPGADTMDPSWGHMQGNINLVTVQGNVNLVLGGPTQGMTNLGWGSNPGSGWVSPNVSRSPRNGNLPWDRDGQRKYGGERFSSPREWGYQGRQPWGRQPYGGGGYSRPLPKGQRVCKFYESGHCKKGAFCDYLHP